MAFAGLERDARVAHLARGKKGIKAGQGFVNHHWSQFRHLEHGVGAIGVQIAGSRLFDVLDS